MLILAGLILSGCAAQMAALSTNAWVDGPDHGRKVFCVGSDRSISCDWQGYHLGDRKQP